jgi:phenylacetic acid degradation operon negative regulatory protein
MAETAKRNKGTRPGSPPSLLLTLLGDYWWHQNQQLPSAALVELLHEFGVTEMAARQALSRLVKQDFLASTKSGRNTFYGLTGRAKRILTSEAGRIFAFGTEPEHWDGLWSVIAFSIPETSRSVRENLRGRLRALGFAPLYDGMWVSPQPRLEEGLAALAELGVDNATALRATVFDGSPEQSLPVKAWNLDETRCLYEDFIAASRRLQDRLAAGTLSGAEALIARTQLMDSWRSFPRQDPRLPAEVLPPDWPLGRARALFIETYAALAAPAVEMVRRTVARHDPEAARYVAVHESQLGTP